jgi:hypothetical protein
MTTKETMETTKETMETITKETMETITKMKAKETMETITKETMETTTTKEIMEISLKRKKNLKILKNRKIVRLITMTERRVIRL